MEESVRESLRELVSDPGLLLRTLGPILALQDEMVSDMMCYIEELRAEDGGSPSVWIRWAAEVAAQLRSLVEGTDAQAEIREFEATLVAEFKRNDPDYDPDDDPEDDDPDDDPEDDDPDDVGIAPE